MIYMQKCIFVCLFRCFVWMESSSVRVTDSEEREEKKGEEREREPKKINRTAFALFFYRFRNDHDISLELIGWNERKAGNLSLFVLKWTFLGILFTNNAEEEARTHTHTHTYIGGSEQRPWQPLRFIYVSCVSTRQNLHIFAFWQMTLFTFVLSNFYGKDAIILCVHVSCYFFRLNSGEKTKRQRKNHKKKLRISKE